MSSQELKFYKCKLCEEADLIAGNYCIDCAKKNMAEKALNTKGKSPGYPFIGPSVTPDYEQEFIGSFGTSAGTETGSITLGSTDQPIWTNFTSAGNATNIDLGTSATVPSGSAMDFGFGTNIADTKNTLSSKRKISRHQ